jgi:hypothetical protein
LAEIVDFTVDVQPRLLFYRGQVRHDFHQVAHHLLADSPNEGGTFGRDADHDLAPIFPHARAHNVADVFETCDQPARGRRRMPHLLRDGRHREYFLVIKIGQEKKLREGNVAGGEFFAEVQDKTALHLHDDMRQLLGIRPELISRVTSGSSGSSGIQRALKLKWSR